MKRLEKLFQTYLVRITVKPADIKTLTLRIIYGLLQRDEKRFNREIVSEVLKNKNFVKAAFIVSIEIVLFIGNVEEISFYKLTEAIGLDLYEFWKIINPFTHFDLMIPGPIRIHFSEIEIQLLTFMVWKKNCKVFRSEVEEFLSNPNGDFNCLEDINQTDVTEVENIEFNNQSLFVYL